MFAGPEAYIGHIDREFASPSRPSQALAAR